MIEHKRPTFEERFTREAEPACWAVKPEYLVRFWEDHPDGTDKYFQCHGFALDKLKTACFIHETQTLSLTFREGTFNIVGPKAFDFFNAFCTNTATFLKSNGIDILSVKFDVRYNAQADPE
jgi:hypothetical protein